MDPTNPQPAGPDWTIIGGLVVAVVGGIATLLANAAGLFKQRGDAAQERQKARDEAATRNAEGTFKSASELIDQYQDELKEKRKELAEIRAQFQVDVASIKDQATAMERRYSDRIADQDRQIETLQRELSRWRFPNVPPGAAGANTP